MSDDLHDNVRGILPDQPPADFEWRESALRMIRQTAEKIDDNRRRNRQSRLADSQFSRTEWAEMIRAILAGGPYEVERFLRTAAWCIAAVEALTKAEDGDPFLGDAA